MYTNEIVSFINESSQTINSLKSQTDKILAIAEKLAKAFKRGKKAIAFGNGGSASDAQHFMAELVGRYKNERKGLPATALTTDTSVLTAIANDYGYEKVFERQIEANACKGDIVFGISTSGKSPNVNNAIKIAKKIGCDTVALIGKGGGELASLSDISLIIDSDNTARIQEAHALVIHILCELVDKELAKKE